MDCRTCGYADWAKTRNGRMHPSGDGKCLCPIKMPTLPKAYYWTGLSKPHPAGGYINRHSAAENAGCQRWVARDE